MIDDAKGNIWIWTSDGLCMASYQGKNDSLYIVSYLRYLMEVFQSWAGSKKIDLRFEDHTKRVIMDYDARLLKEILNNLLSNALKFTSVGG